MRVRVSYIVDVDDGYRRAIVHYSGGEATQDGRATRTNVVQWFREYGDSMDNTLNDEHAECCFKFDKEAK